MIYTDAHGELQYYDGSIMEGITKFANHASAT